ncbi:MAG: zinc ribbon domain-containing protein [Thermoplasmata archaeon]|nr:zinc ribbon domain-containing protein [Thermoplasmata archaeon]
MPVCLHCGQLAPDGGLFCPKCGFTLPQSNGAAAPPTVRASPPLTNTAGSWTPASPAPQLLPASIPNPGPASSFPMPPPPSAAPPMYLTRIPPPPNGKYCVRCGTLISRPAVYCPVCQQPQGP